MSASRTRNSMYHRVANLLGMKPKEVKLVVDTFLNEVADQVVKGNKIHLQNFGIFERKFRKPRIGRHPKTGEAIKIPARFAPTFKASKVFQQKANNPEN